MRGASTAGCGESALVKFRGDMNRVKFAIINRRNTWPMCNGEILTTDDDYPIMTMSRDWAYKRQKQGHKVTATDFL